MQPSNARRFVEVPGLIIHQLPPLLVRFTPRVPRIDKIAHGAKSIIETDLLTLPDAPDFYFDQHTGLEIKKVSALAMELINLYLEFVLFWEWGNSIVSW